MYLHTRLLLGILWVTTLALCASAVLPFLFSKSDVSRETDAALEFAALLHNIESDARTAPSPEATLDAAAHEIRVAGPLRHVKIVLVSSSGALLAQTPTSGLDGGWLVRELPRIRQRELSYPVTFHGGAVGTLRLYSNPVSELSELEERVRSDILLMAGAIIVVALSMYWTVRRGLRPISRITDALTRLAAGDRGVRLPPFRLRDLDMIGDRFNHCAAALQEAAAQRLELTRRLMQVQEEERTRVARELHDELGQILTAVKVDAAYIMRQTRGKFTKLEDCARDIERLTTQLMELIRGMLARLRPHGLESMGLKVALEELVDSWRTRVPERFRCKLTTEGPLEALSPELNITLYRLVQECLTNAVRHSNARLIAMHLAVEAADQPGRVPRVWLRVEESDSLAVVAPRAPDGTGLMGMRERVEAHGGEFRISAHASGFSFEAWMPLQDILEEVQHA